MYSDFYKLKLTLYYYFFFLCLDIGYNIYTKLETLDSVDKFFSGQF